jgi:hypothetical protein
LRCVFTIKIYWVNSSRSVIDGKGPRKEWDIDFGLISEDDYIALIIDVSANEHDTEIYSTAVALVLRRILNMEGNVYMHAGTLDIHRSANNFQTWIQTWERSVVKII